MTGTIVSHYKILEKLGEGGMGKVYKAQDTNLERFVALKFLLSDVPPTPEDKRRFLHEAIAASSLDHQNIGTIHSLEVTDAGQTFIVMAYYEGESLKKKIESGVLPLAQTLHIAAQIAEGMATAHENNIVHRDLKPANVMMTKDNIVKVVDFGIAKLGGRTRLTGTGYAVGTASYMSPEQTAGKEVDSRSDIWSLGVVMYEMLTGEVPFPGNGGVVVAHAIIYDTHQPVSSLRDDIPSGIEDVVQRCLQKDPSLRYSHMRELASDLHRLRDGPPVKRPLRQGKVRQHLLAGLIVCIALVASIRLINDQMSPQPITSIAVLPFKHSTDVPEYLADGLTQGLIARLSELPNLRVISNLSVFRYKGRTVEAKSIGKDLNVDAVLKGTIARRGDDVSIDARMVDTRSNGEVWNSEPADRQYAMLDATQEIAKQLAVVLEMPLGAELLRRVESRYTVSKDAYDAYLRGINHLNESDKVNNGLAIEHLTQALKKDSTFSQARVALAHAQLERYDLGERNPRLLTDAVVNCTVVLRQDSMNANATAVLGVVNVFLGDTLRGVALSERALRIDPNNRIALTNLGSTFSESEPAKGVTYFKKVQEIDPFWWAVYSNLGAGHAKMRDFASAKVAFRQAIELGSKTNDPWLNLGFAYEELGQTDSALQCYRRAHLISPDDRRVYESLGPLLLARGKSSEAESLLAKGTMMWQSDYELLYVLGVSRLLKGDPVSGGKTFAEGLRLVQWKRKREASGETSAFEGLFQARVGNFTEARRLGLDALAQDSTGSEVVMKVARIYALLGDRAATLEAFQRAKRLDRTYNLTSLSSALDFEAYRNDPELLAIARQE